MRYGQTTFAANSTELTTSNAISLDEAGRPYEIVKRVACNGYLDSTGTQTSLTLLSAALDVQFAIPYQDLIVFQDDGGISNIALYNSNSISGVRITGYSFPEGKGVNWRKFHFEAEAAYPYQLSQGSTLSFSETVNIGGVSPLYVVLPCINALPQRQLVYPAMPCVASQRGHATGYKYYPVPPAPLWPYALKCPPVIDNETPRRRGPSNHSHYKITWSYQFEWPTLLVGLPNIWKGN